MKILTLDIETQPHLAHVWRVWKENISPAQIKEKGKVIMVGCKWWKEDDVMLFDDKAMTHKEMVVAVHELMSEADAIVGHNIERFDIGHLNTEIVRLGLHPPAESKLIDTLKVVKQRFNFSSNKLDSVARELGLGSKLEHPGFDLWKGWMNDDPDHVQLMRDYCVQDVRLTEDVYEHIRPWIKSHPNTALYGDMSEKVCTNCGSNKIHKKGQAFTKVGIYQRYKCQDCGCNMRGRYSELTKEQRENVLVQEQ